MESLECRLRPDAACYLVIRRRDRSDIGVPLIGSVALLPRQSCGPHVVWHDDVAIMP
jgi:hypothetical protein